MSPSSLNSPVLALRDQPYFPTGTPKKGVGWTATSYVVKKNPSLSLSPSRVEHSYTTSLGGQYTQHFVGRISLPPPSLEPHSTLLSRRGTRPPAPGRAEAG